jgi:hypothetical protein
VIDRYIDELRQARATGEKAKTAMSEGRRLLTDVTAVQEFAIKRVGLLDNVDSRLRFWRLWQEMFATVRKGQIRLSCWIAQP